MSVSLSECVLPHAGREDLAERMAAFYEAVDAAIAVRGPICRNRGECCNFRVFGHRLYVTHVELAYFLRGRRHAWRTPRGDCTCPYQVEGRCVAREHRPLGCRVYYCDPLSRTWQGPEYERRLSELKRIGTEMGVAYGYTDWLSALAVLTPAAIPEKPRPLGRIDGT